MIDKREIKESEGTTAGGAGSLAMSMDDINVQILRALQENARISFSELGRRVGLTSPAVADRVHRMEDDGIITGYAAAVDREMLGWPITAFVRLCVAHGARDAAVAAVRDAPSVIEAHSLTGADEMLLKVATAGVRELGDLISELSQYGSTTSQIVISTPVASRAIDPRDS